jgi:broad specificity phosphatase PhoE
VTGKTRRLAPDSPKIMAALTADQDTKTAEKAAAPGAIILARHGEPGLSRKIRFDAEGYRKWWAQYEEIGLREGQTPPLALAQMAEKAGVIIASTRRRSVETATAVAAGRAFSSDPLFIEAPLPPPRWPTWIKLSPRMWGFVARVWWWFFNHHDGQETRAQAEKRALQAADMVSEMAGSGQDVLIVAHGFFNTMIGEALKARGWRCTQDQGFRYWKARIFRRG